MEPNQACPASPISELRARPNLKMADFQLSAQLKGHDSDVRAVAFPKPDAVFSASRDHSLRVWRKTVPKPPNFEATIIYQGDKFVNSLVVFRPRGTEGTDSTVAYGGTEAIIEIKKETETASNEPGTVLVGHANNVCSLDASPTGSYIVSGSWDGKAIVWDPSKGEVANLLTHDGEPMSVWAVLAFSDRMVITGCADNCIRMYFLSDKANSNLELHPRRTLRTGDVVRALCRLPSDLKGRHPSGAEFASAGNDGAIRLWDIGGKERGVLHGHDSFIYSLASLPSGEIVSSGEDRTVRIWRGMNCVQTITHPAISVWTVAVCPQNGDIVSGASDNIVRVFTRNADRVADTETISEFENAVKSSAIPQEQLGTRVEKEKLDTKSWLETNTGTKDGQVKMIREDDGSVSAYQWAEGAKKTWIHVGTVVEAAASSGRKVPYNGKEYDFVFDVDIEDGKPPLKLPYNLSDDTYQAATKFLNDNELPISYLESVASFIRENTKAQTIGQTSGDASAAPDEFAERNKPRGFLPHTEYLGLTQGKLDAALRKLTEFNSGHIESGRKDIAMNPDGVKTLEALVKELGTSLAGQKPTAIPNPLVSKQIIHNVVTKWPYNQRLPALDILRCMVVSPGVASLTDREYGSVINIALKGALDTEQPVNGTAELADFVENGVDWTQVNPNNVMMALRTATNLFATAEGRALVTSQAGAVIGLIGRLVGVGGKDPVGSSSSLLQVALITTAFNFACFAYNQRQSGSLSENNDTALASQLLSIAEKVIKSQSDGEVLFRATMTVGMLLSTSGEFRAAAKALGAVSWLNQAADKSSEPRIKDVVLECKQLIEGAR